jgi:hypothetical protein
MNANEMAKMVREAERWRGEAAKAVCGSPEYHYAWGMVDGIRRAFQLLAWEES